MNWTALLTEQAESAYAAARACLAEVDDSVLAWKPSTGSNWMTVGQLIRHITSACGGTANGFATGEWAGDGGDLDPEWKPASETDFLPPATAYIGFDSKQAALDALVADRERFLAAVATAGDSRLASERSVAPWGGPERSLGSHFLAGVEHLNTHKAQLFYYLKLQAKPVHTGTLYGM